MTGIKTWHITLLEGSTNYLTGKLHRDIKEYKAVKVITPVVVVTADLMDDY